MTNLSLGRHIAAIAATLLVSTACVIGAVGPATAGQSAPMATVVRA
ncbi:hypothetical protein [Sphingomonas sp.]